MPKKTPPPTLRTPSTGGTSSTSHTSSVYFSSQNGGLDRHLGKPRCPNCRQKFMSHEMVEIHLENCPVGAADQLEEVKVEEIDKGQQLVEMAQIDAGCHECGRQFQSPRGLKLHKTKMHRRGRPTANPDFFQCSKCPFQSRTKGNLKNHERTHKEYEKTKQNDGDKQHSADQRAMATVVPNSQAASQASRLSAHQKLGRNGGRHSLGPKSSSSSGATFYGQIKHRRAVVGDENEEDDEILEAPQKKKSSGRPRQLIARKQFGAIDSAPGGFGAGSAIVSHYAGMVINACAQSNLVTFHDVNTAEGTIGKITFQFQCNKCRGALGVARCTYGRAYCIICCGHPECD